MKPEFYQDKAGQWRWRVKHSNGRILADSGEGYSRKSDAQKGFARLTAAIIKASNEVA